MRTPVLVAVLIVSRKSLAKLCPRRQFRELNHDHMTNKCGFPSGKQLTIAV